MKIDNNINRVTSTNLDIKQVISEGGVLWKQRELGPGPTKLIGGNLQAGFYGEVRASEFITGVELARRTGLTEGISQFSNEPWLKFSYLGKVEFIAKKTFKHTVTFDGLSKAGVVYGNKTIDINGITYKVRLIKGKTEGKQDEKNGYSGTILHNSEWNRLMLPIHVNAPNKWEYPKNVESTVENWGIGYTDGDLLTNSGYGKGSYTLCQEHVGGDSILRRGYYSVSCSDYTGTNNDSYYSGWRPVLELVD